MCVVVYRQRVVWGLGWDVLYQNPSYGSETDSTTKRGLLFLYFYCARHRVRYEYSIVYVACPIADLQRLSKYNGEIPPLFKR